MRHEAYWYPRAGGTSNAARPVNQSNAGDGTQVPTETGCGWCAYEDGNGIGDPRDWRYREVIRHAITKLSA